MKPNRFLDYKWRFLTEISTMTGKCGMVFGGIYRFHRRAFRSFKLSGFLPLFLGQKNWLHTFDGKLNDGRTQKTTGTTEKKRRRQVRG